MRKKKALFEIPFQNLKGLEFGPLDRPLVRKTEADISYLDYMSREKLMEHYRGTSIQIEEIQSPDFIVEGQPLSQVIPARSFDYLLASHVAEHVPDLIGWLQELSKILKDDGIVSLILPDKRFTFDQSRTLSLPHHFIEAHLKGYQRPSPGQIYDFFANEIRTGCQWKFQYLHKMKPGKKVSNPQEAFEISERAQQTGQYINVHCWVWTPLSFLLNLKNFMLLQKTDFLLKSFHSTSFNDLEFFVQLKKIPRGLDPKEALQTQLSSLPQEVRETDPIPLAFEKYASLGWKEYSREFFSKLKQKAGL